jgi:nitrite reductase (NADH) small subunit
VTSESVSASSASRATDGWTPICAIADIAPDTGVCALVEGQQVAVFRVGDSAYAIDNRDPFTGAHVLSRGLISVRGGVLAVASPLHKQRFALTTGACVDDPSIAVNAWRCRVRGGAIEVAPPLAA